MGDLTFTDFLLFIAVAGVLVTVIRNHRKDKADKPRQPGPGPGRPSHDNDDDEQ